jgi:AcrR family transcriptional regulator
MVAAMDDRLSRADWIRHGLRTLGREGVNGLKVGPMAAQLAVSRGSFYWHFKDIADFRGQVLARWAESTTEDLRVELAAEDAGTDRLKLLMRRVFAANRSLDRAIRSWAAEDAEVAAAVAAVDAKRTAYIVELLVAAGVEAGKAARRGAFIYWALLGQTFVMDPVQAALADDGMDDISDLFEA